MTHEDDRIRALARMYEHWTTCIEDAHYRLQRGKKGAARLLLDRADEWVDLFKQKERELHAHF